MKKLIFSIMILIIMGMPAALMAQNVTPMQEWNGYNELIKAIKSETDFAKRIELMHKAEDMLMETYAVIPLFYYNDAYLQSSRVSGIYTAIDGSKFFFYAQKDPTPSADFMNTTPRAIWSRSWLKAARSPMTA